MYKCTHPAVFAETVKFICVVLSCHIKLKSPAGELQADNMSKKQHYTYNFQFVLKYKRNTLQNQLLLIQQEEYHLTFYVQEFQLKKQLKLLKTKIIHLI